MQPNPDILIGTVYSSSKFRYGNNHFKAEFSEVPHCLRELWRDDIKCGFGIQSDKSGQTVFFTIDRTEIHEGVKFLIFTPTEECLRRNPILEDIHVVIRVD